MDKHSPEVYPNVIEGCSDAAGRTLIVHEHAINEGQEILQVRRPLAALDSGHLQDTCSSCHLWLSGDNQAEANEAVELKACLGCKVVKYCSKASSLPPSAQIESLVFHPAHRDFSLDKGLSSQPWMMRDPNGALSKSSSGCVVRHIN